VTPEHLYKSAAELSDRVLADPRWQEEHDDLGVSVFGMLLYGFALAKGRIVMMLDIEDINTAVTRCLIERAGVAAKWAGGLVEDASRSAFDKAYHPGQHELIGVGHSYWSVDDLEKVVDNVFSNIQSVRRRAAGAPT
jgi:hypothetical protein